MSISTAPATVETPAGLDAVSDAVVLEELAATASVRRQAELHELVLAYEWAVRHPGLDGVETPAGARLPAVLTAPETLGGEGTPAVAAFTSEPVAVALGVSPLAALSLLADTLDLHHRLPLTWDYLRAGSVEVWRARRLAAATRHLSLAAAAWVDRQIAGRLTRTGSAALDRLIAQAVARCEPDRLADTEEAAREVWDVTLTRGVLGTATTSELTAVGDTVDLTRFHDLVCAEADALASLGDTDTLGQRKAKALGVIADAQARLDLTGLLEAGDDTGTTAAHQDARRRAINRRDVKIRLYLHASLTDLLAEHHTTGTGTESAVGTVEALGPVTLESIRDWCARGRVTVVPVLHVVGDAAWSSDAQDPPPRMAEQVRLRDTTCVFPRCTVPARHADLDHIEAYDDPGDDGPPAQTRPDNLAPLCRRHHRTKTTGHWSYQRIDPATYLWTGPHGVALLVTPSGTVALDSG